MKLCIPVTNSAAHAADYQARGGCSGHSHGASAHGEHHCGATGGCGGHGSQHGGGACCAGHGSTPDAAVARPRGEVARIAVSSQNRKTVTEHAGKCRKFWIFDVGNGQVVGKTLVELAIDQSFHATSGGAAHPLDAIDVLLTSGIGSGLQQRLRQRGIEALLTTETDPDLAVAAYLAGAIPAQASTSPRRD